jgi:hypothetical protein
MNSPLPRLLTDFNSADENEAVVLIEDVQIVPNMGEWVKLADVDGNTCEAVVNSIDVDLIYARPLWSTWREADTVSGPIVELMEALRASVQQAQADRAGREDRVETTEGRARVLDDVA